MKSIKPFYFSSIINGVQVMPLNEDGMSLRIRYIGQLTLSGSEIFVHYGFGEPENWINTKDAAMERKGDGWELSVKMESKRMNFCFRDKNYNWDNNNGNNWTYVISE